MNPQRRLLSILAVTLAALSPAWTSAADDEPVLLILIESVIDKTTGALLQVEATAAGQAVVIRSGGGNQFGAYDVREQVDPQDGVERFALLLPGGPLIVEATMTLGGRPFRAAREALIDEMLTAGDSDEDGVVTWDEALQNSRFTYGRILPEQQRTRYVEMLDHDKNGEVDRAEARGFLAVIFQGPAFYATGSYGNRGRGRSVISVNGQVVNDGSAATNVWTLIDTDSDGTLSETEIAEAGERLKSRDADDNDLLYTGEIGGNANAGRRVLQVNVAGQRQRRVQQPVIVLGLAAKAETLFAAIQGQYQTEDGAVERSSFSAAAELFDRLDADDDETLSQDEVLGLNDVEPLVRMTVDLGMGEGESTLSLTSVDGVRELPDGTESTAGVELPGVAVTFEVNTAATRNPDYNMTAQRMLDQYDSDNNEYLEVSELPENFGQQIAVWDSDADGKVYKQDIVEGYTRSQVPQQTQIQASVTRSGDPLFPALDLSGDSRLSLREMRTAHVQLASLDADGDGQITRIEVPVSYAVNFRIGNGGNGGQYRVLAVSRGGVQPAAPPTGDGPQWFLRMDRNGDGDVTLREFLGGREAFEELDTDVDGFIEPAEAEAVSRTETDDN